MKIILIPIAKIIAGIVCFVVGVIYSVLYFIYDPKGMIKEKLYEATRKEQQCKTTTDSRYVPYDKLPIDWKKTLLSADFWCPFFYS